jgi:hypothetical protein
VREARYETRDVREIHGMVSREQIMEDADRMIASIRKYQKTLLGSTLFRRQTERDILFWQSVKYHLEETTQQ